MKKTTQPTITGTYFINLPEHQTDSFLPFLHQYNCRIFFWLNKQIFHNIILVCDNPAHSELFANTMAKDINDEQNNNKMFYSDLSNVSADETVQAQNLQELANEIMNVQEDSIYFINHPYCIKPYLLNDFMQKIRKCRKASVLLAISKDDLKYINHKDFTLFELEDLDDKEIEFHLDFYTPMFDRCYNAEISDEAVNYCISKSKILKDNRNQPDKALYLLEQAYLRDKDNVINEEDIDCAFNELNNETQVPEPNSLNIDFVSDFTKEFIGQAEARDKIQKRLLLSKAGLCSDKKPLGSFMFVGPTGLGKTAFAKVLSKTVFNSELVRFDMGEFSEAYTVSRFLGSPNGYAGCDENGEVIKKLGDKPHCVILFDEFEKAHPSLYNVLLTMLDEGYITDRRGKTVSVKDCIIIFTSNCGVSHINNNTVIGFTNQKPDDKINLNINIALKETFSAEFLNRIDDIIYFRKYSIKETDQITGIKLKRLEETVKEKHNILLKFDRSVVKYLINKGYSETYGIRALERAISDSLTTYISQQIIEDKFSKDKENVISVQNGTFKTTA
ncbi:MAG: ATP-dependent Clp protease ATP-binding subunit [Armatimonadetes bacterium]|nr:ATP-dependent Clp protease ATP-binding subunit [Candidatus Hippobium faecium]